MWAYIKQWINVDTMIYVWSYRSTYKKKLEEKYHIVRNNLQSWEKIVGAPYAIYYNYPHI